MTIDYEELVPRILTAMFPNPDERLKAEKRLGEYGTEHWHWAPERVRVAILKLAFDQPESLDRVVEVACSDYRDVLYFAETPLSFQDWNLPEENPQKYAELVKADQENYSNWLKAMGELPSGR
jgi:hypothetical protein